jgi:hypothetical protein
LEDLVLYAELLALQIVDRILVGERTAILLFDGTVERGVFLLQYLEAILQQHAQSSSRNDTMMTTAHGSAAASGRPEAFTANMSHASIQQEAKWREARV